MSIFPTTVLLATDGSKDAELATTTALDLANDTSLRTLLHRTGAMDSSVNSPCTESSKVLSMEAHGPLCYRRQTRPPGN